MPGLSNRFRGSVNRLLRKMPVLEFEEWRALYNLEPWSDERTDEAVGTQIAYQVAIAGDRPKSPADYMRYLKQAREAHPRPQNLFESEATMKASLKNLFANFEPPTNEP